MRSKIVCSIVVAAALVTPSVASAYFPHTVLPGESLYSIAAADGVSVDQLAAANGISPDSQIQVGSTVMIPPQSASTVSSSATSSSAGTAAAGSGTSAGDGDADSDDVGDTTSSTTASTTASSAGSYVVQPGDTLSAIAARAGMSVAELAASNGLDPNGLLVSGTVLRVPAGGGGGATYVSTSPTSSASAAGQPVGSTAQGNPTSPPYPTPERVSASEVGSIANANGVPPSLAQAIGWQESGFNNDLVSSADARGVMQILPGTWDWIQHTLTAGTPLAPASAASNVRGGVLLLHSLLNSTGGDPAMAAAGYYQGLSSVRQNGLYPDTQQYVNSVMALARHFGGG